MNILVTGACGFQGSHLTERLLGLGHRVFGLGLPSRHAYRNYAEHLRGNSDGMFEMCWGSVTDTVVLDAIFERGIELVFHLGAKINVDESLDRPLDYYNVNIIGTHNILALSAIRGARVIMASTCEVLGENQHPPYPMDESHPLGPQSPYALSKVSADRMCAAFARSHDLNVQILRPFNIYGERQKDHGKGAVIPILTVAAMRDKYLTITGDGSQKRDYLHVSDVIEAYITVMEHERLPKGDVYHVGSGEEHSIREIADTIVEQVGKGKVITTPPRPGDVMTFACDPQKIQGLGWRQQVEFDDGLRRYIGWRLQQG